MPAYGYGRQDFGIFTNLEPDHIGKGEHRDFEDYLYCKSLLYPQTALLLHKRKVLRPQVCRRIDPVGLQRTGMFPYLVQKYFRQMADAGCDTVVMEVSSQGLMLHRTQGFTGICTGKCSRPVTSKRIPRLPFSFTNARFSARRHNAMALESLLTTLRAYEPHRLVCLFGCGERGGQPFHGKSL